MRQHLLEIEGFALRIFAALESHAAAEHEQKQVSAPNLELDRPWDRDIWAIRSSGLLGRAAAALERNDPRVFGVFGVLGAVKQWLEQRLKPAPTLTARCAFMTAAEIEEQRAELERQLELELAEHAAALKARLEELAAVVSGALEDLDAADPERQLELELAAKNGGAA
jgi:hypothetical protein